MADLLDRFADLLAAIYHEGRNVRHLLGEDPIGEDARYRLLRDGLPRNRYEAWKAIQLRAAAAEAKSAHDAEGLFVRRFGLTLNDMHVLYLDPRWKGSPYGGNQWAPVTESAIRLRDIIDYNDEAEATRLVVDIDKMQHNTGHVGDKIRELDRWLAFQDGL